MAAIRNMLEHLNGRGLVIQDEAEVEKALQEWGMSLDGPDWWGSIGDIFLERVRRHKDYAFGVLFTRHDFPDEQIPEGFDGRLIEERLIDLGNEYIFEDSLNQSTRAPDDEGRGSE